MSTRVDEIWEALKARTAPGDNQGRRRDSSAVLRSSAQHVTKGGDPTGVPKISNISCGATDEASVVDLPRFTQRDVNCLSDPDRNTRKKAILKLRAEIDATVDGVASLDLVTIFESEALRGKVLQMLGDQTDVCRETSVEVLRMLIAMAEQSSVLILQAVDALKVRMGVGLPCPLEYSEEIRMRIANLTATVLVSKVLQGHSLMSEVVSLLVRCIDDPFHEAKKCACLGVDALARGCESGNLTSCMEIIIPPLLEGLRHPHSRVRSACLQALTSVGENSPLPREMLANRVVPALRTTALDKTFDIRLATFRACGSWMKRYIGSLEDSMFMPHLLPILLLGITDSSHEARAETMDMLTDVAQHYCEEQQGAQGCYIADHASSSNYDQNVASHLSAPLGKEAPATVGSMINAQLEAILPPVLGDIREWTAAMRSTASRSLYGVMALAGYGVTPHLQHILPCLCQAVGDDDEKVTERMVHCIHVVGAHCEVHHWIPLMLEYAHTVKKQPSATICVLVTMAGLALAAHKAQRPVRADHMASLSQWLASEETRSFQLAQVQRQLVMVVANVIDLAGPLVAEVAQQIFHVLLHLQGQDLDDYTKEQIVESLSKLAAACGVTSASDLAGQYSSTLLSGMLHQSPEWEPDHPDIPSFLTILRISPGDVLTAMGGPLCQSVSLIVGDHEKDPALRMTLLRGIDGLLQNDEQATTFCAQHGQTVLKDVILPPLIWRAGKSAAAVRYSALHALYSLLSLRRLGVRSFLPILTIQGQLLPLIFQSMDEDWYQDTRKLGCCTLAALLKLAGGSLTDDARRQIYPELVKRMDDSSNEVRISAAGAIQAFACDAMPPAYCDTNSGYFIGGLLIHLDDSDSDVQTAVFAALRELKAKKPTVVQTEVRKVYDHFISKQLLDDLVNTALR